MEGKRYAPDFNFPPYAFLPGKNTHPNKPGGHREGLSDPFAKPFDFKNPLGNIHFLQGLDLFNFGYYWEAHVEWEAVWIANGKKGPEADFLKGLIKLAAGGVKFRLKQRKAYLGHIDRGLELFDLVLKTLGENSSPYFFQELLKYSKGLKDISETEEKFPPLHLIF